MKDELTPPSTNLNKLGQNSKDIAISTTGSIPVVGGIVVGVLGKIFPPALEQRRKAWEVAVSEALNDYNLTQLSKNDEFITLLIEATEAARRTHSLERIKRLKFALVNHESDLEFDMKIKFIRWVDSFSIRELTIFSAIAESDTVTGDDLINDVFSGRRDVFQIAMEDIDATKSLVKHRKVEGEESTLCLTTVGEEFCRYIGLLK